MYRRFRLKPYLYLSITFLVGIINRLIYYFENDYVKTYFSSESKITFYLLSLSFMLAFTDFKPRLRKFVIIAGLSLFSFVELIIITGVLPMIFVPIADETFRIILALVILNAVVNERYVVNNFRSKLVRIIFFLIGILILYLGTSRLILFLTAAASNTEILLETYQARDLVWATVGLLTVIGSVFFPELFLITHSQISYVYKLYGIIPDKPTYPEEQTDHLLNYLKSLPKELFEEAQN